MDLVLPNATWGAVIDFFAITSVVTFACYYVPLVATLIIPWILSALLLTLFYHPTPLMIKRVEALYGSQITAHASELVHGASALRLSPAGRNHLIRELHTKIDAHNRIHFMSFTCRSWASITANMVSCIIYCAVGLFAIRLRSSVLPGVLVALFSATHNVIILVSGWINCVADVQRGVNSVERLAHYENGIGQERREGTGDAATKDASWPRTAAIEMRNLSMRYRPQLPLVIQGIDLSIRSGEKIGIVGRTGAGKSTIFSILLGMVDATGGCTLIDGVDIATLGVQEIRKALAVIPQHPTLFSGTVRTNLDPRHEHSDEELLLALSRTGLSTGSTARERKSPSRTPLTLSSRLEPGGANLSTGQRQLLSLARALVRNTRIILIDEATSGVDYEMDGQIQTMLRTQTAGCTVLAIAHRIHTVKDYDRLVVMDAGRIVEVGAPRALFDQRGFFWELCEAGGVDRGELESVSVSVNQG